MQLLTQTGPSIFGFALPLGFEAMFSGEANEDLRAAAAVLTRDRLLADGQFEKLVTSIGYLHVLQRAVITAVL